MKPFRYLPKAIRVLLLANLTIFILAFVVGDLLHLHLNLPGVGYGNVRDYITVFGAFFPTSPFEIWRYFTYMFVHVDFWHFLFNMLMLWMFGDEVAEWMGTKHFTIMYLFCGVFAAFFSVVMCFLGLTNNPIIGASGALMGIFVAYYRFFPDRRLLLFFVIPMKIKYAMWVMVAIDVFMAPSGDGIAHLAHLGGVVAGFIYMFVYEGGFGNIMQKFRSPSPRFKVNEGGRYAKQNEEPDVIEGEVFYLDEEKRIDEILKKVSKEGVHSLNEAERQFLLKTGDKIRRRRGGM